MPQGPLNLQDIIQEYSGDLSNMSFTIPIFNSDGKQPGTQVIHPDGPMVQQMANALGTAIFNILKNKVLITVEVEVTTAPGEAIGTGTVE